MLFSRPAYPLLFLPLIVFAGCGGQALPPGAKPTFPSTVTVTYKGAPVEGAIVTFIADPAAYGRTDASGVAKMKTYVEGDGAIAGTHKVTITKAEVAADTSADVESEAYVPPDENTAAPAVTHLIPAKYGLLTSGLTADVKDGGENQFKFDLVD